MHFFLTVKILGNFHSAEKPLPINLTFVRTLHVLPMQERETVRMLGSNNRQTTVRSGLSTVIYEVRTSLGGFKLIFVERSEKGQSPLLAAPPDETVLLDH